MPRPLCTISESETINILSSQIRIVCALFNSRPWNAVNPVLFRIYPLRHGHVPIIIIIIIIIKPLKKETPHSFKGRQLENKSLQYRFVICMSFLESWLRFTMICPKTCDFKSCTFTILQIIVNLSQCCYIFDVKLKLTLFFPKPYVNYKTIQRLIFKLLSLITRVRSFFFLRGLLWGYALCITDYSRLIFSLSANNSTIFSDLSSFFPFCQKELRIVQGKIEFIFIIMISGHLSVFYFVTLIQKATMGCLSKPHDQSPELILFLLNSRTIL